MQTPTGIEHNGLRIQPRAYRLQGQTKKALLTYDQSLKQLREAGYERHLRPAEAFTLLAKGLEERLTPEQIEVHDDMLTSYGEWLSMAMERQGDTLITYLDSEGLTWDGEKYVKPTAFNSTETKSLNITGIKSQQYIDLNLCGQELVRYLYGRACSDLPIPMRDGSQRAQLYLPVVGMVEPMVCGGLEVMFDLGCYFDGGRASRGVSVVDKQKSSP